jgi:4-amino-4-deoxy-L-arabinose transferase-like glycosyltransferase
MTGGRAIVDDGLIASRLGAVSRTTAGDHVVYAHHPPLVYVASAAALAAPGSVETDARLPVIAASLLTSSLMAWLLFQCGFHPVAAALGLLVAFALRCSSYSGP